MINSYWIQANTRAAMAARNMFWIDFWGVIVASFFILALVVALLGTPKSPLPTTQ
ncbi:MAG: hypothetical protein QMB10_03070 [Halioglobus sp.]